MVRDVALAAVGVAPALEQIQGRPLRRGRSWRAPRCRPRHLRQRRAPRRQESSSTTRAPKQPQPHPWPSPSPNLPNPISPSSPTGHSCGPLPIKTPVPCCSWAASPTQSRRTNSGTTLNAEIGKLQPPIATITSADLTAGNQHRGLNPQNPMRVRIVGHCPPTHPMRRSWRPRGAMIV